MHPIHLSRTISKLLIVLVFLVAVGGCDAQLNFNECEGAPPPPTDEDYLNLVPGTAIVDGPDRRLDLTVQVDIMASTGNSFFVLGASSGQVPRIVIHSARTDLGALMVGDETSAIVFYNVAGALGGPGRLRIESATSTAIEGTFAGCVGVEEDFTGIDGPSRVVHGGFSAARD